MQNYSERLKELVAKRDEVNSRVAPVQVELDEANLQVERAQLRANDLARQIDEARGGQAWIELKREIAMLTRAVGGSKNTPTAAPIEFVAEEKPQVKKGFFSRLGF